MRIFQARVAKSKGFTLIELLVVLLLIGAVAGAVIGQISFLPRSNELESASKGLESSIIQIMDLGQLRQKDYGLFLIENHFKWLQLDTSIDGTELNTQWNPIEPSVHFETEFDIPESLVLSLVVDAQPVDLDFEYQDDNQTPTLVIQRDGEQSPPLSIKVMHREDQNWSILQLDGFHEPEVSLHAE